MYIILIKPIEFSMFMHFKQLGFIYLKTKNPNAKISQSHQYADV